MSAYGFSMNLVKLGGGFQGRLSKVGSAKHLKDVLEEDDPSPSQSDVMSVVDQIEKDQKCQISWLPDNGHSFQPLKGKPSNSQTVLYLFLTIRDDKDSKNVSFSYRVTLKGLTVDDVLKDPRMGEQVVKISFTSLAKKRD